MENRAVIRRIKNRLETGRQIRIERQADRAVLVQPGGGDVLLNESAAAILELCDGTRTRDQLVAEFLARAGNPATEADARDFLDAALQRGWIVEA